MNYNLWPMANFINFYFVPPIWRVLYSNLVSVVWETYLSTQVNKKVEVEEEGRP